MIGSLMWWGIAIVFLLPVAAFAYVLIRLNNLRDEVRLLKMQLRQSPPASQTSQGVQFEMPAAPPLTRPAGEPGPQPGPQPRPQFAPQPAGQLAPSMGQPAAQFAAPPGNQSAVPFAAAPAGQPATQFAQPAAQSAPRFAASTAPQPQPMVSQRQGSSQPKSFENVVGKNVLGILASVLVFCGLVFLGILVVPSLADVVRCVLMYVLSFALVGAGVVLAARRKNAFSMALAGCGCGSLFISVLVTYLYFQYFSDVATFALLLAWMAACLVLVKRFDSMLLSVVVHAGLAISVCLAYAQGFDDAKALVIIGYQALASALVIGGSVLCFRKTYRFGLFASLALTVVASSFMWAYFGGTGVAFASSLPTFVVVLAFCLQFLGASVLSFLISISTMKLEDQSAMVALHVGNKALWLAALFTNVFPVVRKLAAMGGAADVTAPATSALATDTFGLLAFSYGGTSSLAIYACLACLLAHALTSVFLRERLGFSPLLGRVSVLLVAGVAAFLLAWRFVLAHFLHPALAGSLPNLPLVVLVAVLLYALARLSKDPAYGVAANVFLGIDAFAMVLYGYYGLTTKTHLAVSLAYMAVLVALVFFWWRGLGDERRQRAAFPAAFACLVGFEVSFASALLAVGGRGEPLAEYRMGIVLASLLALLVALFLLRFEDHTQAGQVGRLLVRLNEYVLMAFGIWAVAFDGIAGAYGSRPWALMVLYLVVAALVLLLLALRMGNVFRRKAEDPTWMQVVSGLAFTLLCLAVVRGSTHLLEQEFAASIICMAAALVCVTLGLVARQKPLRLYGLVLVLLCVLKLVVLDVGGASTLMRVVAFIGGGLICFAISALYNYAVKRLDRPEKPQRP